MHQRLIEDKKAKSKSFFLKHRLDYFDDSLLNFLRKYYKKFKTDIRICLHKNSYSIQHYIIILQQKKKKYQIHKHLKKGETYHIIYGAMMCFLFDRNGKIIKKCLIKKNNIFITPINVFHTMKPITEYVIYHESKPGPFLNKNDSIFPKWKNMTYKII